MAASDELRLPGKEPTYFNKEALIGLLFFNVPGAVFGSLVGKERMERESREGKPVAEPTMWNKDAAIGAGIGYALSIGGILIGGILGGIGGLAIGGFATIAIGALIGGAFGKSRMKEEYQEALNVRAQQIAEGKDLSIEREQEVGISVPSYSRNVSPVEAALLEEKTKQGGQRGPAHFTEQLEQARKQPAPSAVQV
ncbi:MAG: hypothetical protein U1E36_02130 [Rickettsiales bacterium]